MNSSRFSNLISDSRDSSLSKSSLNPVDSNTLSINSVKVNSFDNSFNFSIIFLNSNSLPDVIAS